MGIVLGAIGGMGEAMQGVGKSMLQDSYESDKEQRTAALAQQTHAANSQVDLQRQQALEDYKVAVGNQQRDAQVSRINTAASGIVGNAINQKYAGSDAAVAAAAGGASPDVSAAEGNDNVQAALTPDQLAVINQSKASDTSALANDTNVRTQAAIQTGDIAPKDAMNNTSKVEINQIKMENLLARADDRNASMKENYETRAEAQKYAADLRLQAAQEKLSSGRIDTATGRMLITSEDVNIKAATTQIGTITRQLQDVSPTLRNDKTKPNPDYVDLQGQLKSLREDIATSKANKLAYLKQMNVMPDDTGAAPSARGPSPYTDGGTAASALPEQLRIMQGELDDPNTSDSDKAGIQREMDRLRSAAPIAVPRPAAPIAIPRPAASSARPPLSTFLK